MKVGEGLLVKEILGEVRKLMVALRRKRGGKLLHPYALPAIYEETSGLWVIEVKYT